MNVQSAALKVDRKSWVERGRVIDHVRNTHSFGLEDWRA